MTQEITRNDLIRELKICIDEQGLPLYLKGFLDTLAQDLERLEVLEKENKELKDKATHYKNKFYTTHQNAEHIKDTIREFFNILSLKGLLNESDNEDDKPVREIFNNITQQLERLNQVARSYKRLVIAYNMECEEHDKVKKLYEEQSLIALDASLEAAKLKRAIEILKDKLKLSLNDNKAFKTINAVLPIGNNDINRLTQQEYELLKEVFL